MGIHVIQSQRIEVLVQALLTAVNQASANPFQVLQPQHFIVPSKAVEVWLTQQLAEQKGISANTQFHHRIRGFQWSAYQWVLHEQKEQVRKANIPRIIIKWRVFQALKAYIDSEQITLTADHALYPIIQRIYESADRLQGLEKQLKKQSMLYWVAEQVSRLFSNYMVYRGHCQRGCQQTCHCATNWLEAWGKNQPLQVEELFFHTGSEISAFSLNQARELEAWQRWLWQAVFHQDFEEMQNIDQQFWQMLEHPETRQQALSRLPQQLTVFTLLDLPPSQLAFLRRLGQYLEIYILHYNPSQEYWADSVDPHWKARYDVRVQERFIEKHPNATDLEIQQFFQEFTLNFNAQNRESRHPLLTRLGKQARDHFSLLSSLSSGEDGVWADVFVDDYPQTLLGKIQSDVLYLVEPQQHQYVLAEQDDSIQIHVCHSSLRQLEVLKEQLIHWLAQGSKEQPRRPSDILVLSPNLKELEPLIRSVFAPPPSEREHQHASRLSQHSVYLPIKIAGVTRLDANLAWRAVLGRMQLLQGRFTLEDLADWLGLAATQQYYTLENHSVERMVQLLTAAGFKRGFDAQHLQQSLAQDDEDYRFSFKFALDRLALGIAIPEHRVFQGTLSFAEVLPSDFELIAQLIQIYQDFDARRHWLNAHEQSQTIRVEQWLQRLKQEVDAFLQAGVESLGIVADLIKKQERILTLAEYHDPNAALALQRLSLPLPYLIEELNQLLDAQLEQAEPTGQITFSQLGQIRPLPYKLMVILNLDSGKFPSRQQHVPFDLMDLLKPQLGDRSRLEDDQGAFLDALLLAQQSLWLFYNGFDVNDGEVRDPSTVLQELVQHMAFIVKPAATESDLPKLLSLNGIEVPEQLQSLYHLHPLQPFDPAGFACVDQIRYQDQWFEVARQIRQASGQREGWTNVDYTPMEHEVQVLDSQQWIQDVLFPARLYLKTLGIKNLSPQDLPEQQEPLLLNRLQQYHVRNSLLQQQREVDPAQFLDVLPVGKTQQASWQLSLLEQSHLRDRMHKYALHPTSTTQQLWKVHAQLHLSIHVPQHETLWLSVQASKAKAKSRAKTWLEYLMWLAYLDLGTSGRDLQRIVVCPEKTMICQGISSAQAQQYLQEWFAAWHYAQRKPLVLPAALLLEDKLKLAWTDQAPYTPLDSDKILQKWNESDSFAAYPYDGEEWNIKHRDWQFILQHQDANQLLQQALQEFSYVLYQPILSHLTVEEA